MEKNKRIVATKLQKLGPKIGGRKKRNCGSQVAKLKKKKKKREKLICGNGIVENGRKKRIAAMELPKIGGERERE